MIGRSLSLLFSKFISAYRLFRQYFLQLFGLPPHLSTCRFQPTCSQYCQAAFNKYSLLHAFGLCLRRLLRCHPLVKGGYDPLP